MGKTLKAVTDSFFNSVLIGLISSFAVNVGMNARGADLGIYETIFLGAGITLASTCIQFPFYEAYYGKKEARKYKK